LSECLFNVTARDELRAIGLGIYGRVPRVRGYGPGTPAAGS
jgi:hypothetical protein